MSLQGRNPAGGGPKQGRLAVAAALAVATVAIAAPAAAENAPLATFRSVHDLVLDRASPSQGVVGVTARLVTEFTGAACKAFTDRTRFVMQTTDDDGKRQVSDLQQTTTESITGHFTFDERVYANNKLVEQSLGTADRGPDGKIAVSLSKPAEKPVSLAATVVFPTELLRKTVAAAKDGKRFLAQNLYSGDSAGETIYATSTVIGAMSTALDFGADTLIGQTDFATMAHWPVTIAYFDTKTGGDAVPLYVTSYVLYENGMVSHLKINYPDFALVGTLTSFDLLPGTACS